MGLGLGLVLGLDKYCFWLVTPWVSYLITFMIWWWNGEIAHDNTYMSLFTNIWDVTFYPSCTVQFQDWKYLPMKMPWVWTLMLWISVMEGHQEEAFLQFWIHSTSQPHTLTFSSKCIADGKSLERILLFHLWTIMVKSLCTKECVTTNILLNTKSSINLFNKYLFVIQSQSVL